MATYTNQFVVYDGGSLKKTASGDVLELTGNLQITGDLTVTGNSTTTTISTTNTVVSDKLFELGNGVTGAPSGDAGIIIERGDSANAIIAWDESEDKFVVGTTTATGASTGDLTITTGTLLANVEGTASSWANARTVTFATGDVTGSFSIDGSADVANVALTIGATTVEGSMLNANTVDDSTLELTTGASTNLQVKDSGVTLAKLADLANMSVIGNVSGSSTTPSAITINDTDTMSDASATTLATSESIKAYVDTEVSALGNVATSDQTFTNGTAGTIAAKSVVGLDTSAELVTVGSSEAPIGVNAAAINSLASGAVTTAWGQKVDVLIKSGSSEVMTPGIFVYNSTSGEVSKTPPTSGLVYRLGITTITSNVTENNGGESVEILWMPQFIADLG